MLLAKKCQFVLYLDLVKIRLEIMLNYFREKRNLFDYKKKTEYSKVQNIPFFFNRLIHAFGQNMPFFSLFRFDQNQTRNKCALSLQ